METQNFIPPMKQKEPFNFMDFLDFKRMITLQVIPVFYAIVAMVITVGSLFMMFAGSRGRSRGYGGYGDYDGDGFLPFSGFFAGLIFLIVGNILWRMWCEFIIVLFRINKNLQDIERNTNKI